MREVVSALCAHSKALHDEGELMATILIPTLAEALAAVYLHERDKCVEAVEILSEAIDRLHDVARRQSGASDDEIALIINRAQETARETLMLYGGKR